VSQEKAFGQGSPEIADYATELFKPEDKILIQVREMCIQEGLPAIQVGRMDGLLLESLTRLSGAKTAVEIGTLGGYSGICLLRGLGSDGKLYTFEYNPVHARMAKKSFELAGLTKQVELHEGAALEKLKLIENKGPFDLVFIDADKNNYVNYFKWAAKHLRVGGAVLADNTCAWGMIHLKTIPPEERNSVEALQRYNSFVVDQSEFRSTLLPTAEGLTLSVKIK
jgi:caffeoyl-CoA O-methyltransferase